MKLLLIILYLLAGGLFSEGTIPIGKDDGHAAIVQTHCQDNESDFNTSKDARLSGENTTIATPVRYLNSNRRTQSSVRSSFRIIKSGKVLDRHFFDIYLQTVCSKPSGALCSDRYIFTIGHLLI